MRRFAVRALAALFGVLAACNAISGLDEDFVLVTPDGGSSPDGANGLDGTAPTDGSSTNDGPVSDASDGGVTSDAFSCTTIDAAFCADFDTDSGPWDKTELLNGTVTYELDAGQFGTGAMHAHVDDAQGTSRRAAVWKTISGANAKTFVHYDVEFDFRIANKSFPYSALGIFALTQPSGGGGLRYYGASSYGDKHLDVIDDPPITSDGVGVEDTFGTWHHAIITLDREPAGTYAVVITIDGTKVDDRPAFDFGDAQTAELRIGILFTSTAAGTMDLYVDNIVVHRTK